MRTHGPIGVFAVLLIVAIAACSHTEPSQWIEEVQLSDGRIVRVQRVQEWDVRQPIGQNKYFLPAMGQLKFVDAGFPTVAWSGYGEMALLLDKDASSDEFFLITIPETCERYEQLGRPKPPYREYRYRDSAWKLVPLSRELIGRKTNLLVYPEGEGEKALVSVADKESRNSALGSLPRKEIRDTETSGNC